MISFTLTDEQRELQALAHDFAANELRPIAGECDKSDTFPLEVLAKAAAVGLTSYAIPEEFDGGVSPSTVCLRVRPRSAPRCYLFAH